jgi:hypothetical protein
MPSQALQQTRPAFWLSNNALPAGPAAELGCSSGAAVVEEHMDAEVFIRGKVAPTIVGAFRNSVLYRALSSKYPELVLWGSMKPPSDGYCYCSITSEQNGVVRELAVVRYTNRLEEQVEGTFGEIIWMAVEDSP